MGKVTIGNITCLHGNLHGDLVYKLHESAVTLGMLYFRIRITKGNQTNQVKYGLVRAWVLKPSSQNNSAVGNLTISKKLNSVRGRYSLGRGRIGAEKYRPRKLGKLSTSTTLPDYFLQHISMIKQKVTFRLKPR